MVAGKAELALQDLGIGVRQVQRSADRIGDRLAPHVQGANELEHPVLLDHDEREAGTDGGDRLGSAAEPGVVERTGEGGRLQIDGDRFEVGLLQGVDEALDQLGVRGGDQDPQLGGRIGLVDLGDHLGGQRRRLEWKRHHFVGLETDRVLELFGSHEWHVDLTSDGPEAGDADVHPAAD